VAHVRPSCPRKSETLFLFTLNLFYSFVRIAHFLFFAARGRAPKVPGVCDYTRDHMTYIETLTPSSASDAMSD